MAQARQWPRSRGSRSLGSGCACWGVSQRRSSARRAVAAPLPPVIPRAQEQRQPPVTGPGL
eukprot:15483441-Alexandrium_andersonii.AAC.1